ncbi:hypothetical protein KKJFFJLC_00032 [Vibrio phage vB_VpaS_PGB]|nr:hypothetical protein HHKILHMN_00002 [Vibrio phage vB_VpaS_PGA]WVH05575.1 hypothetical protein KKJFFJLC_00032 [Vibrio phage vB_VpaS_PGB]
MELIELQNKIHQQNVDMGWWENKRTFHTLTNLGVSEISEAVEAHRKNLNDDKLKKYHGTAVEAVDGSIRTFDVLDWLGNKEFSPSNYAVGVIRKNGKGIDFLMAFSTYLLSSAWEAYVIFDDRKKTLQFLRDALFVMFEIVYQYNLDPIGLILEKLEYNRNRPDHKRENRAKENGKKY